MVRGRGRRVLEGYRVQAALERVMGTLVVRLGVGEDWDVGWWIGTGDTPVAHGGEGPARYGGASIVPGASAMRCAPAPP